MCYALYLEAPEIPESQLNKETLRGCLHPLPSLHNPDKKSIGRVRGLKRLPPKAHAPLGEPSARAIGLGTDLRVELLESRQMLSATIEVPGQGTLAFDQSATAANPAAFVTLSGQTYQQAFDAEFNGTSLDTSQWDTDLNGQLSQPYNGDQGVVSASQDVVSGGQLLLAVSDVRPPEPRTPGSPSVTFRAR